MYRQGSPVLYANVVVGGVVAAGAWNAAQRVQAAAWFAATLAVTAARAVLFRRYRRSAPDNAELVAWGRRFVLGTGAAGMLWGAAGIVFFQPHHAAAQALLTFAIGGMTAASAGTLSCHLPAFQAFFFLALAPLTARTFLEGGGEQAAMGILMLVYAVGIQYVAMNNHRAFDHAFRLGLENAELVAQLSRSQLELEQRVLARTTQLEQRSEALRRAQRLEVVGKLAGSLAHDFNNLLTVVLGNASTLKDASIDDEHRQAAADETLQAARRGAGLIRQLLSLTHRQRTEPRVFSVNQLVTGSQAVLRSLAGEGVTLRIELGPEPSFVLMDPAQMEQVLTNLASAACAAMPRGGELRIRTGTPSSETVSLSVEDDGEERRDSASTALDGAIDHLPATAAEAFDRSLGLAVARTIIAEAGGQFLVEASGTRGTHFQVTLPAAKQPLSVPPMPSGSPEKYTATILAVDDEPALRAVIRRSLVREGYQVLLAEDGERALAVARSYPHAIDLLVTDVIMPGVSGPELSRRLRAERPEVGVLFISGYSFEENIPVTDGGEGMGYLAKPFDATTLANKVRQLLDAIRQRDRERAGGSAPTD